MITRYETVPVRRTHIGLVLLVIICLVAALGFYRGWFKVTEQREPVSNNVDVNLRVNTDKMQRDVRRATDKTEQKTSEWSHKINEEAKGLKDRATN